MALINFTVVLERSTCTLLPWKITSADLGNPLESIKEFYDPTLWGMLILGVNHGEKIIESVDSEVKS